MSAESPHGLTLSVTRPGTSQDQYPVHPMSIGGGESDTITVFGVPIAFAVVAGDSRTGYIVKVTAPAGTITVGGVKTSELALAPGVCFQIGDGSFTCSARDPTARKRDPTTVLTMTTSDLPALLAERVASAHDAETEVGGRDSASTVLATGLDTTSLPALSAAPAVVKATGPSARPAPPTADTLAAPGRARSIVMWAGFVVVAVFLREAFVAADLIPSNGGVRIGFVLSVGSALWFIWASSHSARGGRYRTGDAQAMSAPALRLIMRQKLLSLREAFEVKDGAGNKRFDAIAGVFSLGRKFDVYDHTGRQVAVARGKLLPSLRRTFYVETTDGLKYSIFQNHSVFKRNYSIEGDDGSRVTVEVDILDKSYTFRQANRTIGVVTRKWLTMRDCCVVEVLESEFELMVLLAAIVIRRIA